MFINNLKTSQRAWLKFRDAQLTLIYPEHSPIEKINLLSSNELIYLAFLTEDRTNILIDLLNTSTTKTVYVSDLQLIRSDNIHVGIGLDQTLLDICLINCGNKIQKSVILHPEYNGRVSYAEFIIPKNRKSFKGIASSAGWDDRLYHSEYLGKMSYRIFVDGELVYKNELFRIIECQN